MRFRDPVLERMAAVAYELNAVMINEVPGAATVQNPTGAFQGTVTAGTEIDQTTLAPQSTGPTGPAGGDLSGTYPNPTVAAVDGVAVSGTPTAGQVLTATSGTAADWATPASALTAIAVDLASPVALTDSGFTDVLVSPSLAIGTYLLDAGLLVDNESADAGTGIGIQAAQGTATATFDGKVQDEWIHNPLTAVSNRTVQTLVIHAIVTVTVAGTIKIQGQAATTNSAQVDSHGPNFSGSKVSSMRITKIA